MFLEKFSRFVRRYHLVFRPAHKAAPAMPLVADEGEFSVWDALEKRRADGTALLKQKNGDVLEMVKVQYFPEREVLVLLFHRGSPDAADPMYRRRIEGGHTVRQAEKEEDEEQSVSAHLVISTKAIEDGRFDASLEEIPGINMSLVQQIIAQALHEYPYDYQIGKRKIKTLETVCLVKAEGLKSETISGALKEGKIDFITFIKPAPAKYVDADGLWEPMNDVMRLKVKGKIDADGWQDKIGALVDEARADGWEDFNIEIDLGNKRSKTIALDREQDAKEILFVKSEEIEVATELSPCSVDLQDEVINSCLALMRPKVEP
jgi:hypothetical protein